MAKSKTRSSVFMHTKTLSVTIRGKHNCVEEMTSVASSSCPCQSRYDVGMGFGIMSRG